MKRARFPEEQIIGILKAAAAPAAHAADAPEEQSSCYAAPMS